MPPTKHALLSASSSHRWLNCTPSARLELEFEDQETEAAAEGTAAHALCEHKLRRALKLQARRKPISKYDSDEMDMHTDNYVQFVLEALAEARQHCADPVIHIEQRLDFSCYVPDGFGTGDCVIVGDKTLHIIDFKYGQPFKLLPWQEKIIRDVFGTVREDDPTQRQYTSAYIEIPKKNGKSELGAAIALNMLVNDDEWKAEVYSCAADRQQAAIVFDVAVDMVKQSPALMKRIKIIPSTKRMVYQPTGSIYQVLSSEVATKHGLNVSACIFDELHTQPTRALYDVMTQGSGDARKQPLWFFLTTAGTDRNSICWEVHQKALDILEGRKDDPRFYPVLFGLPDEADWTDEQNWYHANPSLDYTISIDKVRDAYRKALETPADENMFRQLRLNQWVKQSVRWMPMDKWDDCGGIVSPYDLEGRACYGGLDLSSTSDLTTLVLVFPPNDETEPYIVLPFFWLPEDTLQLRVRRDHVMYDKWEKQGYLMTTEGNVVHYGFIEQFICQLGERYNIREIAYDRWNATMMVQSLQDDGFTMVPFGQGYKDMSPPTKELMRLVLEHKINHGGHPVLRWNMDNAFVRTDPAGNVKIDKEKSTEKVDGAVALVMALDRALKNNHGGSVYDDRGLLFI